MTEPKFVRVVNADEIIVTPPYAWSFTLTRDKAADLIAQLQCALRDMHQMEKTRD